MKLDKGGKFVLDLVIYLIIIGVIVYGLPRFLAWYLHSDYPMAAITSGSMWPVLKQGDLVFIKGVTSKAELQVGDIVIWRASQTGPGFVIHRAVELKEDALITKGDANFTEDPPVPYSEVVGKALVIGNKVIRIPWLGSVTTFASSLITSN